jgi:hypothetical protein
MHSRESNSRTFHGFLSANVLEVKEDKVEGEKEKGKKEIISLCFK